MLYIPLYIKTDYSLLDSLVKIKDLVLFAKDNGYKALSIVDDNLCGVYEFYKECINNNIKPIIGLEVKVENYKILLYAKGDIGYKNLIALNQIEDKNIDIISKYSDDLICIVPFESKSLYNSLNKVFKDIFVGYKNKNELELLDMDNIIYVDQVNYINKNDKIYYMYLTGIKNGKTINEIEYSSDNYLKNIDEIDLSLNDNYKYIYDNCNLKIEKRNDLLPIYDVGENYTEFTYLKEMCRKGLKKRFGDKVSKVYIDRIKYELNVIKEMGFCNYFLVVMDYVRYAKESGILVGPGRGSAAGSLVAYVLEITEIDPIRYNLMFERFLNSKRVTMPDIDIDFENNRRSDVINYCINKYGEKNVAGIITFGTLASRQVIRDVSRVMDYDQSKIDYIAKLIDSKDSLKKNLNNPKLKEIIESNKDIKKLYDIALKLEGIKRHTSVNAAGIIISSKSLDQVLPIIKHDDMYLACFTKDYLEEIGLLKMDFLSLKNLTMITEILEEMKKDNILVDFNNIPLNDPKTFEIFRNGNTNGIFQYESNGMKNFLKKLKPNSLEDLFSANAIFRPGPMDNIDLFVERKHGIKKIDYIDNRLEDILKPTYGIIVYQEQIMKISNVMAGYNLEEADILRRAMSKKKEDILIKEKDKFISGSIKNGYSEEIALKVYNLILKFSEYGFNRSHSVAYSIISYKMAYLKANYPKYFMKCLLDYSIGTINIKDSVYEAKSNDIKVLNPDINKSYDSFTISSEGLIYPLNSIKNVGYNVVKQIVEERKKGLFTDIFDFMIRMYSNTINKNLIINLINSGCFDSFNVNHRTLIENLDIIINYVDLYNELEGEAVKPNLVYYDEYSESELLQKSFDVFGFYLSNHPVTNIRLKDNSLISLNLIKNYFDKFINIVVIIDRIKVIDTKNNEKMCFISGSDEFGSLEIVLFPKTFALNNDIKVGEIVKFRGRIEKRFDEYQMVVSNVNKI